MKEIDGSHSVDRLLQLPCAGRFSGSRKRELALYPRKPYKGPLRVAFLPILKYFLPCSLYIIGIDVSFQNQKTELHNEVW